MLGRAIWVSWHDDCPEGALPLHPRVLHLGIGCRKEVTTFEILDLVHDVFTKYGLAKESIASVGSVEGQAPRARTAGSGLGVRRGPRVFSPRRNWPPSACPIRQTGCSSTMGVAQRRRGVGPARLPRRRAGRDQGKVRHRHPGPLPGAAVLKAVSLGPGDASLPHPGGPAGPCGCGRGGRVQGISRAGPARSAGRQGNPVHGHDGRGGARPGARSSAARSGKRTVMVCSGDAGIYAMAGLLLEILEAEDLLDEIPFEVVPGVAAFNGGCGPCSARRSCTISPPSA